METFEAAFFIFKGAPVITRIWPIHVWSPQSGSENSRLLIH